MPPTMSFLVLRKKKKMSSVSVPLADTKVSKKSCHKMVSKSSHLFILVVKVAVNTCYAPGEVPREMEKRSEEKKPCKKVLQKGFALRTGLMQNAFYLYF